MELGRFLRLAINLAAARDKLHRRGLMHGVVESIGEGVRNIKPSDRVAFTGIPGEYAEAILAEAERLLPLPDDFSFEQGAAFSLQGMTAHYLIHEFRRPGGCCRKATSYRKHDLCPRSGFPGRKIETATGRQGEKPAHIER
jgi:hypothetical protein